MRDGKIVVDEKVAQPAARGTIAEVARSAIFQPAEPRGPALPTAGFFSFALMIVAAAAQAIGRNKMRSALTMLGVFIGVAALIVMVAVGNGSSEVVRKQIENLGTNVVVILPGALTTGGIRAGFCSASTLMRARFAAKIRPLHKSDI